MLVAATFGESSAVRGADAGAALTPVTPHAENGSGDEHGVYAPPLAGPSATIVGTFEDAESSGASGYYVVTVDPAGHRSFLKGVTDAVGHFRLVVPAGIAALEVFRHFDSAGNPDHGSRCEVSSDPNAHVPGTNAIVRAPSSNPAITGSASSYERGKQLTLQTRALDAPNARITLDGDAASVKTLAASDRSVIGRLSADAPLGRRAIGVQTGAKRTNDVPSDIVGASITLAGPHETGSVQVGTLHVVGLPPADTARVHFDVSGSAELENGGHETTVALDKGQATVRIRGVHAGAAILRWQLEVELAGVQEVAQEPSPTPTGGARPTPTGDTYIHDTPPPTSTPEIPVLHVPDDKLVPCVFSVDGYMQPTQGVWQDDRAFPSPKVLIRMSHDEPFYKAPYPLVVNRPTVIGGVYHYQFYDGGDVYPDDRDAATHDKGHIRMFVSSNCPLEDTVRFHFTLVNRFDVVWRNDTDSLGHVPLHGMVRPGTPAQHYTVSLGAPLGYPAAEAFKAPSAGFYTLFCELQKLDPDTGRWLGPLGDISVNVEFVNTHGPLLHFVPVVVFDQPHMLPEELADELTTSATNEATETSRLLPDVYPVIPGAAAPVMKNSSIPSVVESFIDLTEDARVQRPEDFIGAPVGATPALTAFLRNLDSQVVRTEAINAALTNRFELQAILTHAGRLIVVFSSSDFTRVAPAGAAAYTRTNKVIFVPPTASYMTIGHEIAHTLPWDFNGGTPGHDIAWMNAECARGYHNLYGDFAQGLRFIQNGGQVNLRESENGAHVGMMGPLALVSYIEQCTWRHLTANLRGIPDPPVIVVRGFLFADGQHIAATLSPFYTLSSAVDRDTEDSLYHLHVVVLDAPSRTLASVPFQAHFQGPEDPKPQPIASFLVRAPAIAGAASVEIRSGDTVLASRRLSAAAPVVQIIAPAARSAVAAGAAIQLRWSIRSNTKGPFVSSVMESTDGGTIFLSRTSEQSGTVATFKLTGQGSHVLRVVVSDGSRSAQTDVVVVVGGSSSR